MGAVSKAGENCFRGKSTTQSLLGILQSLLVLPVGFEVE